MISPIADSVRSDRNLHSDPTFDPIATVLDSPDPDTISAIEGAIAKIKELRFVFEHEDNLAALHRLEDELLAELDLLETTKWSVQHEQVAAIFSSAATEVES
jgi:hypothetical protein